MIVNIYGVAFVGCVAIGACANVRWAGLVHFTRGAWGGYETASGGPMKW